MSAHIGLVVAASASLGATVGVGHLRHGAHDQSPRELTMTSNYDMPDRAVAMIRFGIFHVIGVWDNAGIIISRYEDGFNETPTSIVAVSAQLASNADPCRCRVRVEYEWGCSERGVSGETLAAHVLLGMGNVSTLHDWVPNEFWALGDDHALSFLLGPCSPSTTETDRGAVYAGGPLR
jgi:hypothetical protein